MKLKTTENIVVGSYVQTFLERELFVKVKLRALRDGLTLSDFISSAIKDYLRKGGALQAEEDQETSII